MKTHVPTPAENRLRLWLLIMGRYGFMEWITREPEAMPHFCLIAQKKRQVTVQQIEVLTLHG